MKKLFKAGLLRAPAIRSLRNSRDELLAQRGALSSDLDACRNQLAAQGRDVASPSYYYHSCFNAQAGQIEPVPIPANWHADIAEWAAALHAVEGKLFAVLLGAGWRLEIERPCRLHPIEGAPSTYVDGVQGWRNPMLLA